MVVNNRRDAVTLFIIGNIFESLERLIPIWSFIIMNILSAYRICSKHHEENKKLLHNNIFNRTKLPKKRNYKGSDRI